VPVRLTVCGEPEALSVTDNAAEKLAAEAGVKVMEMEQVALAARVSPQVLVWAKSLTSFPPRAIPLIFNVALPVFLSMAVWAALVEPVCAVKLSEAGVSETTGAGGAVPVPVRATVCGEPVALSAIERVAA